MKLKIPFLFLVVLIMLSQRALYSQHDMQDMKQAELLQGIGSLHHPVTTNNPEAQKFFDQGLTMIYGFKNADSKLGMEGL